MTLFIQNSNSSDSSSSVSKLRFAADTKISEESISPLQLRKKKHRRGSYSGDPLQPNFTPRESDPVHEKRPKSLKHVPLGKYIPQNSSSSTKQENTKDPKELDTIEDVDDTEYEINPPGLEVSRFSHDSPALNSRVTQWIHLGCKGEPPSERSYHDSAVIGSKLYVTFGTDGESIMNQIYSLDLGI